MIRQKETQIDGRYRISGVIRTDKMGTLYRCFDEANEDLPLGVYVSGLKKYGADKKSKDCVSRKIERMKRLSHPYLLTVTDGGITMDGSFYCAFLWSVEWEDGLGAVPSDKAKISDWIIRLCRVFLYVHSHGILHGNLNPLNIIYRKESFKLFGFCGLMGDLSFKDIPHSIQSPYSAPELYSKGKLDVRSDLYSIGALWFSYIVEDAPLPGPERESENRGKLKDAIQASYKIPHQIEEIVNRLLMNDPMDRYQSARDVITAINECYNGKYDLLDSLSSEYWGISTRFIGRKKETELLISMLDDETITLFVISGEGGVGKTRLINEVADRIEDMDGTIARGQCIAEEGIPYFPIRKILRKLIAILERTYKNKLPLEEVQIAVLASLLPELWDRPFLKRKVPIVDLAPESAAVRLNDAIYQVFEAVSLLKPTLIIIEDIQWADEATKKLLDWTTRLRGDKSLLICATCQTDRKARGIKVPGWISGIKKENHMHLEPFSAEEMKMLVSSMLSIDTIPQKSINRIHKISKGNIFFSKTLLRVLIEEEEVFKRSFNGWIFDEECFERHKLYNRIDHLVGRHLNKLSKTTVDILSIGSVFGMVFWKEGVKELSGMPDNLVEHVLEELQNHELIYKRHVSILQEMTEFSFTHHVIFRSSYRRISIKNRRICHANAAKWLKIVSHNRFEEFLGPIANHYEKAGQNKDALNYLMQAGGQAAIQFADTEAIDYLTRALEVTPEDACLERYAVLLVRENVYLKKGNRKKQLKDINELQKLADEIDDDKRRVEVLERKVIYKEVTGDYEGAIEDVNVLIDFARKRQDIKAMVNGLDSLGTVLWRQGKLKESKKVLERAYRLSKAASIREMEADLAGILGNVTGELREYEKTVYYCEKALAYDRETANLANECTQLMNTSLIYIAWGDYSRARSYLEQSHTIAIKIGYTRIIGFIMVNLAEMETLFENYEKALMYAERALSIGEEIEHLRIQSYAWMFKGDALLGLKRLDDSERALKRAYELKKDMEQDFEVMKITVSLSMIALLRGDHKTCSQLMEEVLSFESVHTLIGASEPSRVYMMCYHILSGLKDKRANGIIIRAYKLLEKQAENIVNPGYQKSYFENAIFNKKILDVYRKLQPEESSFLAGTPAEMASVKTDEDKTLEDWIKECKSLRVELSEMKDVLDHHRQAEEAMWESERRSRFSAENASDAIIIFDEKENIFFWNKASYNIFGYVAEETRNRLMASLLIRNIMDSFREDLSRIHITEIPVQVGKNREVKGFRKDGSEFPLEISLSVYKRKTAVYFTAIGRDVTERKDVEVALKNAKEDAEVANTELKALNMRLEAAIGKSKDMAIAADAANRAKSDFLANMSHEIRTPMNAIIGMTQLTLDTDLTREQRENLSAVKTSADNLLVLINDILDFSKIEAGYLEIEELPFDLRLTMDSLVDTLAIKAHEKDLELISHMHTDVPEMVTGDSGRLRQILLNLGGNAIKFTEKGEVFIFCEIEKQTEGRGIFHFSVTDTGIGIDDSAKESIFDSFKQADGSITRRFGGTGLGLSISKLLTERMGGSIWVESVAGKGSSFHFTVSLGIQNIHRNGGLPQFVERVEGKRVLIVDDNDKSRLMLREILVKWKMKYAEAETGEQALDIMADWARHDIFFDMVLVDGKINGMDGFEACHLIRKNPLFKESILFMMAPMGQKLEPPDSMSFGTFYYILKPIKENQLLDAILAALNFKSSPPLKTDTEANGYSMDGKDAENIVLNILLVEDNDINRKMATKLIEKLGHLVTSASNGKEALDLYHKNQYDMILMDVQMPVMDGLTATRAIRGLSPEKKDVPIVAMTAYAMKGDREKCLDVGMNDYISKPIDPEELNAKLKKWISEMKSDGGSLH